MINCPGKILGSFHIVVLHRAHGLYCQVLVTSCDDILIMGDFHIHLRSLQPVELSLQSEPTH